MHMATKEAECWAGGLPVTINIAVYASEKLVSGRNWCYLCLKSKTDAFLH